MFSQLNRYDKKEILTRTQLRKFETKLGELILCDAEKDLEKAIEETKAEYILFGIPEDIGIKANMGHGGADSAWFPFLDSFLNIQNNDFLSGQNIFLVGHYDFSEAEKLINVNADSEEEKIKAYRALVSRIDDAVEELVKVIVQCKKIPVIIGGGHNNAYPAIKGAAKGLYKTDMIPLSQINCVNLDPHTDYRSLEGRHSGNAFRYADEDGYLHKYYIIGVHENYLQENIMMDILSNPFIDYISYEDIFIRGKRNFIQAVAHAVEFTEDNYTGVELDLDSIQNVLSSATSPCGIISRHARQYLTFAAENVKIAYLHICEGATKLNTGQTDPSTGKLISYLVSDFIKSHKGVKRQNGF